MPRAARRLFFLAVALAGAGALATPAHAQFGGLGKKIKKAAENAATGKAAATAGVPAPAGAAGDNGIVDITPDRVSLFLAQAKERAAWAEAREKHAALNRAYLDRRKPFEQCTQRLSTTMGAPRVIPESEQDKAEKYSDAITHYNELLLKASQAGNGAAQGAYSDSMQANQFYLLRLSYPKLVECGDYPYPPAGYYQAESQGDAPGGVSPEIQQAFTPRQYGIFRERIGLYVMAKGNLKATSGPRNSPSQFSGDELGALDGRKQDLMKLESYFKSIQWTSWGDVGEW